MGPYEAWFLQPQQTGRAIELFLGLSERTTVSLPRRLNSGSRRLILHGDTFELMPEYFSSCMKSSNWSHWSDQVNTTYLQNGSLVAQLAELAPFGYDISNTSSLRIATAF